MNRTTFPYSEHASVALVRGRMVRGTWKRNLLTFLMVSGPGLIVMEADNDAGAVSTYVQAGTQYGTHLLWLLLLLLPITYFIQEMVVRLGIATGKGHAAMIYQRFGRWWGLFSFLDLQFVNFLTLVTEFAAIALALSKMNIDPRIGVPVAAMALVLLVATGSYRRWERIVVFLCVLDLAWLALALRLQSGMHDIVQHSLVPSVPPGGITAGLVFLVIGIVGTTIAPWQLFFQQSCIADKRLRFADLKWARLDTLIGAAFTIIVAGCMMIAGNASLRQGLSFTDPAQMAVDLGHVFGPYVRTGILLLMINAAALGTTAISLSSAWAYGEVKRWPHSLQKSIREAPGFYAVYGLCVAAAAALVLIPGAPLQLIILSVQVLAGIMLPSAIIFLQLLLNDRELLGERFVNRGWNNAINWTIIVALFALSLILAAQVVAPRLFPAG
ncbi:MAG: Nramp family divalent metal transporter [Acidobacteriaceae bacterium]|nr:Nramp family divalent metal transporter [Acidobacteriota bacterium]MBV9501115.1 Nramp family divalent metal transporter [Acidobacteriaceae bacterium]